MSDQKWGTSRSREIVKDRWIDLRADDCVTASGGDVAPYYVLTYPDWVHVVAVTPEGCLVLVRQYRHAVGEVITELPGGMMDPTDVDDEQAARRELAEETGYTSSDWRKISSLFPNPATHTNRVHVHLALDSTRNQTQRLGPGEEGAQVVIILPIDDVLRGLQGGFLGQAMQVSAVLLGLAAAGRLRVAGTRFRGQTP